MLADRDLSLAPVLADRDPVLAPVLATTTWRRHRCSPLLAICGRSE